MPTITISDETMNLIRDCVTPGFSFVSTAVRRPDGGWDVPVDDEIHQAILDHQLPGDTADTVIQRVARAWLGEKPN